MGEDRHHESGRSLRDVAAWLTTPSACGVFLSTFDLVRIAHSIGTSVTPLNRRFAVEQLFRSAAIADAPDPLFAALIAEVTAHRNAYASCDSEHLRPWSELAGATLLTLGEMHETWQSSRLD